ncbi:MAG: hypothetical protein SVN78_08660, partial [Deferribacterota bacterium]|nr:hypothetical protein [Deferribacterota bacterium]
MRFDMVEHLVSNLPTTHSKIDKDKSSGDNTFQELLNYLRNINEVGEKNTDEASNRDLFNKLNKLKKSIEHLFENGEIFSTKNVNSDMVGKEIPNTIDMKNSNKIINEKIKESLREIYDIITKFLDNFSNEDKTSKDVINSVEHFLDTTNVSKEKASIPNSLEELARSKNFLIGKNKLISNNSDAFGKYVSK